VAIGVPPARVPQRGPSPRAALTVALVALVSIVGFALLGKGSATPPPSPPPAALASPAPTLMPSVAPSFEAAAVTPSPAPPCVTPRVVALSSPLARHPRPLTPTGLETLSPWTGADGGLVADADVGFWAVGSGRLTRLDANGRMTASWTFANDAMFGASGIVPARGGGVWLWGGPDISWFDGERFRDVIAAPIAASGMSWVVDVAEASDGTLWAVANDWTSVNAGTSSNPDGRVFHWDGQLWSDICGPGTENEVSHVAVDTDGGVWVAPGNATVDVSYFDGSRWSVPPSDPAWQNDPARPNAWTSGLVAADDGSLWIAAGGLAHFNGKAWSAVQSTTVDLSGTVALAAAPDGSVWAATGSLKLPGDADGSHTGVVLAHFAGRSWTVFGVAQRLPEPDPLNWATITAVAASRDVVVAATRDGFYRLSGKRWVRTGASPAATALAWPGTLLAVSSEEAWAASWDAGLRHFRNGTWAGVPIAGWKPPVRVFGVARAPDGALAVATDRGAAVLRKGRWTVLEEGEVHAVTFARDGAIWVAELASEGTETTVASFRFDGRAWARTALPAMTAPGWPSVLVPAPGGEVWLLSRGWVASLDQFDGTRWVHESPLDGARPDDVAGLAVAPNGDLWAVGGGGDPPGWSVAHYDGATWTAIHSSDNLAEQSYVGGFAIAPDGSLWVSTGWGLGRFDGERWSLRFAGYGFSALSFAPDGALWAVGPSGAGRLPADQLAGPDPFARDATPPTLSLPDDITVDGLMPSGTLVGYTAVAEDGLDGPVDLTCLPPPGRVFPIGTTMVTCIAGDEAGNSGEGSFRILVKGASRQLEDARAVVATHGEAGSGLDGNLAAIMGFVTAGKTEQACDGLAAFDDGVKTQAGGSLTSGEALDLLARSRRIQGVLGCSSSSSCVQATTGPTGWCQCAIRTDGTLACWPSGIDEPTPPPGTYVAVNGEWSRRCALGTDGTLTCWGPEASPPLAGTFTALTGDLPDWEACAIRTDGKLVCWGVDWIAKTDPGGSWMGPPSYLMPDLRGILPASGVPGIRRGTVEFGSVGSGCSVIMPATTFSVRAIHFAANLEREVRAGEAVTVTLSVDGDLLGEPASWTFDVQGDCVGGLLYWAYAAPPWSDLSAFPISWTTGHYRLDLSAGGKVLAQGEFDVGA